MSQASSTVVPAEAEAPVATPAEPDSRWLALRQTYVGAAIFAGQPALLSALMLPVTAYVIRSLGPTEYGHWATATSLAAAVGFMTNFGLRGTFVRRIAREPEHAAEALAEQLGLRLALAVVAVSAAMLACLALGYGRLVLQCTAITALGLVLTTISTTAADVLQALQRLPTIAMVNMVAGIVLSAASVAAAYLGAGPVGIAGTYLLGPLISIALLLYLIHRRHFPVRVRWNNQRARSLLWGARHIASQQLVWSAAQHAESLMIPRLVGVTQFGFFSAGTLLSSRSSAIPEGLATAAYPAMVSARRKGIRACLRVFSGFALLVLLTTALGVVAVNLIAAPVAHLLFPGQAQLSETVMRITIWLLPSMGLHFVMGYLLNALDQDALQAKLVFAGSACSLALTVVLVWRWGVIGACWSMVLRYPVYLVIEIPAVIRVVRAALAADGARQEAVPPATAAAAA
jgi:O-antigen/teichoic acid export membrane protein